MADSSAIIAEGTSFFNKDMGIPLSINRLNTWPSISVSTPIYPLEKYKYGVNLQTFWEIYFVHEEYLQEIVADINNK